MAIKNKGIMIYKEDKNKFRTGFMYNPNPTSANAPKLVTFKTIYRHPDYDKLIKNRVMVLKIKRNKYAQK